MLGFVALFGAGFLIISLQNRAWLFVGIIFLFLFGAVHWAIMYTHCWRQLIAQIADAFGLDPVVLSQGQEPDQQLPSKPPPH